MLDWSLVVLQPVVPINCRARKLHDLTRVTIHSILQVTIHEQLHPIQQQQRELQQQRSSRLNQAEFK
jgi:hypothetical protein